MPTKDDEDKANEQRNAQKAQEQEDRENARFSLRMVAILLFLCLLLVFSWYILRSGT